MKDIVAVRKYTDRNGNEKKEYINAGFLFEKDGKQTILLKSHINLLAFQNAKGEIWLNLYEHKVKEADATNLENRPYPGDVSPVVDTMAQVQNEGKEYAQKWKELSEGKNTNEDVPF